MIDRDSPVTEDELHAYVDGELPADRQDAVAAWLAAHPEQAALVAAWRAQAEAIRARYGAVANEPVPQRFKLDQLLRQDRSSGRSWAALAAAAAVIAFLAGGAAGWMARGASAAAPTGLRHIHRRGARCLQALRGRGASSGRGAGQRAPAYDAMAVEAARLRAAHSRPAIDRAQAGRRPAAAGPDRSRGLLHV